MTYLTAVLGTLLLLLGFLVLSLVETMSGVRILGGLRRGLDKRVARMNFIATHIDWGGFFAYVTRSNAERVAHDIVHAVLLFVRAVERTLTRAIRSLRERVAENAPAGEPVEGSQLVATIVRFRKSLRKGTAKNGKVGL